MLFGSCRPEPRASFVQSLRCGMTRDDVVKLAREKGYNGADAAWLSRSTAQPSKKREELSLIDLTFREGRLVAVREGKWDPRTQRVTYQLRDLCAR